MNPMMNTHHNPTRRHRPWKPAILASFFIGILGSAGVTAKPAKSAKPAREPAPAMAIELGAPFTDNAILQREMPVPVWGWSKPGTKVTVTFAGQKKTATADEDGKWMLKLDPLEASAEPREMTITEGAGGKRHPQKHPRRRGLAGLRPVEHAVAGRQDLDAPRSSRSSIEQGRGQGDRHAHPRVRGDRFLRRPASDRARHRRVEGRRLRRIQRHRLRLRPQALRGTRRAHRHPQLLVQPDQDRGMDAAGRIRRRQGRIHRSRSISRFSRPIRQLPSTRPRGTSSIRRPRRHLTENAELVAEGRARPKPIPTKPPGNLHGNRDASWLFNARLNPMIPYAIRGAIWNQGYANMGDGLTYYDNLHSMIRGWRELWNRPDLPVYFHQFYSPGQQASMRHLAQHRRHCRNAARHLAGPRHPPHRHGQPDRHRRAPSTTATRPSPASDWRCTP